MKGSEKMNGDPPVPAKKRAFWVWAAFCGLLVVFLLEHGDVEKRIEADECAQAAQLEADMKRRVRMLRELLEDDVVMLGRYPQRWYVPRLVSRTHQPLIREAGDVSARNLKSLKRRMEQARCANDL
ncbi:MAG: hypothetical protein AB7E81_17930 [Hyphomicrobiaceae bacterium]